MPILRQVCIPTDVAKAHPQNPDDGMKSNSEAFVDHSPTEESYWRFERAELLTEAINRLGWTIRTTIWLRDIEEGSVKETAQILGVSLKVVTTLSA